ncbi:MAG: hypothetical protein RBS99_11870 [Rhodospirillales bacterium]|jgi:hypothetical protein|nr:hypothetical protein [Rhodospirillales bacterium]
MGVSVNRIQVMWPTASNTGTLTASGSLTSEAITLSGTAIERELVINTVNASAQTAGNSVTVYWQGQGDPDGDSTVEPDANTYVLARIDVVAWSDRPYRVPLNTVAVSGKLYLVSSAAQNCTVSAEINERMIS